MLDIKDLEKIAKELNEVIQKEHDEQSRQKYAGKMFIEKVSPENQESPLFLDWDYIKPDNIAIYGNRDFAGNIPEKIQKIMDVYEQGELGEAVLEFKNNERGYFTENYKNVTAVIMEYLPPEHKEKYSTKEVKNICDIVTGHGEKIGVYSYNDMYCYLLELTTGKKWTSDIIRGCSQSDWQYIIYSADDWSDEAIENFEKEYFNTGTEYAVFESWDDWNDGNAVFFYCHGWDDDDDKKEIADAYGASVENIIDTDFLEA